MSEPQRKMAITQIDDIWQIAATRWGDPGRRTPRPDPRFEKLRTHLNEIEKLFGVPTESSAHPAVAKNQNKYGAFPTRYEPPRSQGPAKQAAAPKRRIIDDDDEDDGELTAYDLVGTVPENEVQMPTDPDTGEEIPF